MERSRPYVILSAAMTIDGKIGTKSKSLKLSSRKDKTRVHKLRTRVDAILIGKNTLETDNPKLSVRYVRGKNPIRIILDSHGTVKSSSNILKTCNKIPTIVVTTDLISLRNFSRLEKLPLELIKCGKSSVNIPKLLKILHDNGIKRILLEGGGTVNWSFLRNGFVDEVIVTVAPYIIGGTDSISLVEGRGFKNLHLSTKLKLKKIQRTKNEFVIFYKT
tara:strand:+ start:4435 stop:5088 length:654 start_codon:yes stop_codon:yes gene_type:complete